MTWHAEHHEKLSLGQRAADVMRNGMGSWAFMFVSLAFLGAWMWTNGDGFDNFPWQVLNLLLSSVAALQATVILISQKRADEVAAALAQHDADVNIEAERRIEELQVRLAFLSDNKHEEILVAIRDLRER